jgi:hypothetical protein
MIYLSSFACYFACSSFCFSFFSFSFLFLFLDLLEAAVVAVEDGCSSLESSLIVVGVLCAYCFFDAVDWLEPGSFDEVAGVDEAPRISSQLLSSKSLTRN